MQFHVDLALIAVTAALAVRFGVLAVTLPLIDLRSVPPVWRVALAICFAAAMAPAVVETVPASSIDLSVGGLVFETVRSLVVGLLLGFTLNLVFTAVRFAGSVAGMQIGFAIVNSFDPQSGAQVSVVSQFYYLLAVLLFFVTGAHHILVEAMFHSCTAVPPFGNLNAAGGAWYLLEQFGSVFVIGLRMAAPVVLVLLLVSASMGVVVKTVPQLNVLVVGFPIKIAVGLIVLGLSLVFFRTLAVSMMTGLEDSLAGLLGAMS